MVEQFWVDKKIKLLLIRVIVMEGIEKITIKALDKDGGDRDQRKLITKQK